MRQSNLHCETNLQESQLYGRQIASIRHGTNAVCSFPNISRCKQAQLLPLEAQQCSRGQMQAQKATHMRHTHTFQGPLLGSCNHRRILQSPINTQHHLTEEHGSAQGGRRMALRQVSDTISPAPASSPSPQPKSKRTAQQCSCPGAQERQHSPQPCSFAPIHRLYSAVPFKQV